MHTSPSKAPLVFEESKNYQMLTIKAGRPSFLNYMFIVFDSSTNDAVVIDPGWDFEFLKRSLIDRRLILRGIFLTHSHQDHTAAAPELSRYFQCPIYISKVELSISDYQADMLVPFDHNDTIDAGSIKCKCALTPGHTKGSACFAIGRRFFTGDTVFIEGCGLCFGPTGSTKDMFETLEYIKSTIPDDTEIHPGHRFHHDLGRDFKFVKSSNIYFRLSTHEAFNKFCNRSARRGNAPPLVSSVKEGHAQLVE